MYKSTKKVLNCQNKSTNHFIISTNIIFFLNKKCGIFFEKSGEYFWCLEKYMYFCIVNQRIGA